MIHIISTILHLVSMSLSLSLWLISANSLTLRISSHELKLYVHVLNFASCCSLLGSRFSFRDFFLHFILFLCWQSMVMEDFPTIMATHEDVGNDAQLSIEAMEDAQESPRIDEEDELSIDQIRVSKKVNLIATIEDL